MASCSSLAWPGLGQGWKQSNKGETPACTTASSFDVGVVVLMAAGWTWNM